MDFVQVLERNCANTGDASRRFMRLAHIVAHEDVDEAIGHALRAADGRIGRLHHE